MEKQNGPGYEANPFSSLFEGIEDLRNQDLVHCPLSEVLYLLLVGTLCGCDQLTVISVFGEEKLDWFRKHYPYKHGVPSHDTLSRVPGMIDKKSFERLFVSWAAAHFGLPPAQLVHMDGKRPNSSADKRAQSKKRSEGGDMPRSLSMYMLPHRALCRHRTV